MFIACAAGYIWLYYNLTMNITKNLSVEVCLIKHITNMPCPSCGTTRSVISLTKGNFIEAFDINPIGYIVSLFQLIAPIWIVADLILKNNSFFKYYQKIENYLIKPKYAIPLILLIFINWIWNIVKGL